MNFPQFILPKFYNYHYYTFKLTTKDESQSKNLADGNRKKKKSYDIELLFVPSVR